MSEATNLRTEYTADFARRTAERPDTNRAGVIARDEWYTALATDAARLSIYGFAGYQALVDDLLAGRSLNARNEKRVAIVVREVRDLINLRITKVGLKKDAVKRAALNVAREIAMMDGEYGRPKHAAGTAVHIVASEVAHFARQHFEDVQADVAMSAAGGITTHFTSGVIPPLSGETEFFEIGDASHIAALVEYLLALVPALKRADRSEIGLDGAILKQEAVSTIAPLRDVRSGIPRDESRAMRGAIVRDEEHELTVGREAFTLDEAFDRPVEDHVESAWDVAMPVFTPLGVRDTDELQVIIAEMLGEKVAPVPGKKDIKLGPVALFVKGIADAQERKNASQRLTETMWRIQKNAATVGPALRELLAA